LALSAQIRKRIAHLEESEVELQIALRKVRAERLKLLSQQGINPPLEPTRLLSAD